jgi:hydroxymethylbilane synthase
MSGEVLTIEGLVCDLEGKRYYRETLTGKPSDGAALGIQLAEQLLVAGADRVLNELYKRDN